MSAAVFKALGPTVTADEFKYGAAADANDHLIYNRVSGNLYYDRDGAGGDAKVWFAFLNGDPDNLAANDFLIV